MDERRNEGEGAEGQLLDFSDWNHAADLDILKVRLAKATGKEPGCVRVWNLINTCMSLTQELGNNKLIFARNPLGIELILNEVLNYLPVKSLLTCRLVNSSWNAQALHWIKKKMQACANVGPGEFPMFCAELDSAEVLPFVSLKITLEGMSMDHCHKFFTKHGSQLRTLEICETAYIESRDESSPEGDMKNLQQIFRHVPNLKRLSLNLAVIPKLVPSLFDFDEGESVTLTQVEFLNLRWTGSLNQEFLDGLSTLLPVLKELQYQRIFSLSNKHQDWEVFGNFLGQSSSLHTINFPISASEAAQVLSRAMVTKPNASPKLKNLNMCMHLLQIESLEELLRSQSDNLEVLDLKIRFQNNPHRPKRQFPAMKNLKVATFSNGNRYEHRFMYPYFPLQPEDLPKLQTLSIVPMTMENEVFADSVFTSVHVLKLARWRHMNTALLHKIGSRFPNLRKLSNLEISVDVNAMETIITNFPDIEDLELKLFDRHGNDMQNFNLVISGIPREKWAGAQDQLTGCTDYESLSSLIDSSGPSLRDLKSLKELVLECEPFPLKRPRSICIDEIGVYLTFLRLSTQLNLFFRGNFSISDDLAAKLTVHYQNIYFIPIEPKQVN